jgi:hypothetical protein
MRRVGVRILMDRLEVVNVRLCRQQGDDGTTRPDRGWQQNMEISAARLQAGEWIGEWHLLRLT